MKSKHELIKELEETIKKFIPDEIVVKCNKCDNEMFLKIKTDDVYNVLITKGFCCNKCRTKYLLVR